MEQEKRKPFAPPEIILDCNLNKPIAKNLYDSWGNLNIDWISDVKELFSV